jgi:hypothetical protein
MQGKANAERKARQMRNESKTDAQCKTRQLNNARQGSCAIQGKADE